MAFGAKEFRDRHDVSRETMERLEAYVGLLKKWQKSINLIAPSTEAEIWERHVSDSAQLQNIVPNWPTGRWVDLGSGGGFPGIVVAILRPREASPVRLIESNRKKSLFLKEAIRVSGANAIVHNERIETQSASEKSDIVSARACAPLSQLLEWAYPLLATGGVCAFHKGQDLDDELTLAHKCWNMTVEAVPSQTHSHGKILLIGDLERV